MENYQGFFSTVWVILIYHRVGLKTDKCSHVCNDLDSQSSSSCRVMTTVLFYFFLLISYWCTIITVLYAEQRSEWIWPCFH